MNTTKGFTALLIDGFLLALFGLFARRLGDHFGDFSQVTIRFFLISLLVVPYLLLRKISLRFKVEKSLLFGIFILSFPTYIFFFTISVNSIKVANSFFYIYISTLLSSYILGAMFFKESITLRKLVVAVLLVIGMIFFAYPFESSDKALVGIGTGLLSGFFWGVSNATRKHFVESMNYWLIILYQMFFGGLFGIILIILAKEVLIVPADISAYWYLILYAVFNVVFQMLLSYGVKHFSLDLGSVVLASQLVFVVFIGMIFLDEFPDSNEMIGSGLVIFAIILSKLKLQRSNSL